MMRRARLLVVTVVTLLATLLTGRGVDATLPTYTSTTHDGDFATAATWLPPASLATLSTVPCTTELVRIAHRVAANGRARAAGVEVQQGGTLRLGATATVEIIKSPASAPLCSATGVYMSTPAGQSAPGLRINHARPLPAVVNVNATMFAAPRVHRHDILADTFVNDEGVPPYSQQLALASGTVRGVTVPDLYTSGPLTLTTPQVTADPLLQYIPTFPSDGINSATITATTSYATYAGGVVRLSVTAALPEPVVVHSQMLLPLRGNVLGTGYNSSLEASYTYEYQHGATPFFTVVELHIGDVADCHDYMCPPHHLRRAVADVAGGLACTGACTHTQCCEQTATPVPTSSTFRAVQSGFASDYSTWEVEDAQGNIQYPARRLPCVPDTLATANSSFNVVVTGALRASFSTFPTWLTLTTGSAAFGQTTLPGAPAACSTRSDLGALTTFTAPVRNTDVSVTAYMYGVENSTIVIPYDLFVEREYDGFLRSYTTSTNTAGTFSTWAGETSFDPLSGSFTATAGFNNQLDEFKQQLSMQNGLAATATTEFSLVVLRGFRCADLDCPVFRKRNATAADVNCAPVSCEPSDCCLSYEFSDSTAYSSRSRVGFSSTAAAGGLSSRWSDTGTFVSPNPSLMNDRTCFGDDVAVVAGSDVRVTGRARAGRIVMSPGAKLVVADKDVGASLALNYESVPLCTVGTPGPDTPVYVDSGVGVANVTVVQGNSMFYALPRETVYDHNGGLLQVGAITFGRVSIITCLCLCYQTLTMNTNE
jgi:hypothetical protein